MAKGFYQSRNTNVVPRDPGFVHRKLVLVLVPVKYIFYVLCDLANVVIICLFMRYSIVLKKAYSSFHARSKRRSLE
jgi:hypothetical protein